MKNKKTVLALLIFSLASFLFSAELTSFSFEPEFGFLNGKIVENVWNADITTSGTTKTYSATTKLSRLDWQLKNVPYYGADIKAVFNHLIINFDIKNAANCNKGIMEDYDWKTKTQPDHLTNYSIHKNRIDNFTTIDAGIGYIFLIDTIFPIRIIPEFGLTAITFHFSGIGGYRTYEKENWEKIHWADDEVVIEYSQSYVAPQLHITTDFDFTRHFETQLKLGFLYIDEYNAYDIHEKRHEYFNDRIKDAFVLDAKLNLYFKFNQAHKLGINAAVNYMPDKYGFTYYSASSLKDFSETPMSGSLGGTSRFLWSYGFSYCFSF